MHLIAYSPAGKIAAAVAADTIQLYEADTMRRLGDPIKLGHPVTAIALTPDGRVIATGEADSTLRLWNADTGTPRGSPMKGDGPVSELTFGADGHTLVAWGGGRTLQLWNTETSQPIDDPMRNGRGDHGAGFSFDGRMVAAGDQDGVTQLWDIHDIHHPKPLPKLVGQNGKVTSLEFSPDGSKILSASTNGTVRVANRDTVPNGVVRQTYYQHESPAVGLLGVVRHPLQRRMHRAGSRGHRHAA